MDPMLNIAFKEWSAVCKALASGLQTVILRKGGISETGGVFRPEHDRFWLYPTHFHEQQQAGLKPEHLNLLEAGSTELNDDGKLCLTHWVEVNQVMYLTDLDEVLNLNYLHVLNEETVKQRYQYRRPGLYFFWVSVHRANEPLVISVRPEYAGCKTWVEL